MNSKDLSEINKIFDIYDEKQLKTKEEAAKKLSEEELFAQEFSDACQNIIHPTFQNLAKAIESRNQIAEILGKDRVEEYINEVGNLERVEPASITLKILQKRDKDTRPSHYSYLRFSASESRSKVNIYKKTIGNIATITGSDGEYALSEITPEFITAKVTVLLKAIFIGT